MKERGPDTALATKKTEVSLLLDQLQEVQSTCSRLQVVNERLQERIGHLELKVASEQATRLSMPEPSESYSTKILASDKKVRFYTGFQNAERFLVFYKFVKRGYSSYKAENSGRPHSLCLMDEVILVLMRLRVGLLEEDLADRFCVSVSTVSRIFIFWVEFLSEYLDGVPRWPSRKLIDNFMPEAFKELYPTTRVILDCTEIFIETPRDYTTQSATYSNYKSHNTAKGLIGISPNGFVTFVADLVPGNLSDKDITKHSRLYNLLEAGDSVMADRGFRIRDDLAAINVTLNIPPFLNGKSQLPLADEIQTRQIAKLRIHVERVIGQVKVFRILKNVFPNSMAHHLNAVWKVCALLCNFINEPLVDRPSTMP